VASFTDVPEWWNGRRAGLKIVLFRANLSWPCTHAIMGGKVQISAREQFSIVINLAEKNLTERTE
jgi:hypothetical protein